MTKQEKQECLREWWDTVPQGKAEEQRNAILAACKVSCAVFKFWLYGRTEVPDMAITLIEQAIGEPIFSEVMV